MKRQDTWDYREIWEKRHPDRIERMFEDQLRRILNIGMDIDNQDPQELDGGLDNDVVRMIYLGTVMNMTPSGKIYYPFAHSNVTIKEAALDEVWREYMERELGKHNLYLETGEGDPCDIFLCRYYQEEKEEDEDKYDYPGWTGWDIVG